MITTDQIHWLAGLLEGEGFFGYNYSRVAPRIQLCMKDRDVVVKTRDLMCKKAKIGIHESKKVNHNDTFYFGILGKDAVQWMLTLYPLMSERRKFQIKQALLKWKDKEFNSELIRKRDEKYRNPKNKMIRIIAKARKISRDEATIIASDILSKINKDETIQ